jgi:hypothetical protein
MSEQKNFTVFQPADILLPRTDHMEKWSVVACDQYTSQPEYWQRVVETVGDAPSALHLVLPEAWLEDGKTEEHNRDITQTMEQYLQDGTFYTLPNAMIYVERWLSGGKLRRGLVGVVDLEDYDYLPGSSAPIRATEGTVLSRIPPRVAIRRNAPVELPHILMLLDDPEKQIIEHLTAQTDQMQCLYDFDLMEQGGHITGYLLTEDQKAHVAELLADLQDQEAFVQRYDAPGKAPLVFAVGDGNHSLASAKALYEEEKAKAPAGTALPSRYALVELDNLHDDSLEFEPIHRVIFSTQPQALLEGLLQAYPGAHYGQGEGHSFRYVTADGEGTITVPNPQAQLAVGTLQNFLDGWLKEHSESTIDYVHGEDVTRRLAQQPGSIGFLLSGMEKDQLFKTVIHDGVLPRKTFSMGEAQDKRFYLEARKIK